MSKHDKQNGGSAVATEERSKSVVVEQPKEKIGDKIEQPKAATTAVDAKEKKPRKPSIKKSDSTFRILDGVDAAKFIGQRGYVVKALQTLSAKHPEKSFTLQEIVDHTEGLVSKTPVEASVAYHLKAMVVEGMVTLTVSTPEVTEKAPEEAA